MERRFKSKVDAWLASLVGVALVGTCAVAAGAAFATGTWAVLLILIPVALIGSVSAPVSYTLGSHALVVRSGIMKWEIAYTDIVDIKPTRSPLSSPAWSLDRLEVSFKHTSLLISPVDRESFLDLLMARIHDASERPEPPERPQA